MANDGEVRQLGDRQFRLVKRGLDEQEVTGFVEELLARLRKAEELGEKPYSTSLDRLAEQTLVEAEKISEQLRNEAKQVRVQAQAEADQIIEEARSNLEEQTRSLADMTRAVSVESQSVVQAARARASAIEAEGARRAERMLEHTRRQIESQIRRDVKGASDRLVSYVDDVVDQARNLSIDLDRWEVAEPGTSASTAPAEQPPSEQAPTESAPMPPQSAGPDATLEAGAHQVVLQAPVNPAGLGEIYSRLEELADLAVRNVGREGDGSYVINFSVRRPIALLGILKHLEIVAEVRVEPPVATGDGNGTSGDGKSSGAPGARIVVKLKPQKGARQPGPSPRPLSS